MSFPLQAQPHTRLPPLSLLLSLVLTAGCSSQDIRWTTAARNAAAADCEQESVEACVRLGLENCATIARQTCQITAGNALVDVETQTAHTQDLKLLDDLRRQAQGGECLETIVARAIEKHGPQSTKQTTAAALLLQVELGDQQQALGCTGNIYQSAMLAGTDSGSTLVPTAAGATSKQESCPASTPPGPGIENRMAEFHRLTATGECLEKLVTCAIETEGTGIASDAVNAAYSLLLEMNDQQRSLGCTGEIGQAAVAAGADPSYVLGATAAGLDAPGPQSLFDAINSMSSTASSSAGAAPANCRGEQDYYLSLKTKVTALNEMLTRYADQHPDSTLAHAFYTLPADNHPDAQLLPETCRQVRKQNQVLEKRANQLVQLTRLNAQPARP